MDKTDSEILKLLNRDSRIKKNKIAELVHLTPPAVATRIENLENDGIIKKYTVEVDTAKMGYSHQVFIQTQMEYYSHEKYLKFIHKKRNFIRHHFRISGQMNYMIQAAFHSSSELNDFLEELNAYANYQVLEVISELI
ncbi:Lrp/AsnC family transcriptional regulator [Companilactobacillus halodurans]|uniref:Lrp/AsnC family transcriptional regulator n=1 Tax=Companilactobacillus halodurans TaxID=2584183 RepID=A0A5P0ZU73_9LACO|nr:Lrp/AsnC family transcriptional regulator [Companilactobacillus halodurans]MQS76114.1 Lrp/AsnC family transcriptional regulator [Companilactobacillus halodurans]MQS96551.1 Lrp/AsnC family transcriptional regulator [Companilactobacillus halodurans]